MLDIDKLKEISKGSLKLQLTFFHGTLSEVVELKTSNYITEKRANGEPECLRLLKELEEKYAN